MKYSLLPYNQSLSLLTDLYEMTMAYAYWKSGSHTKEAVFHHFFRKNPFQGGFTIACGLAYLVDYLQHLRFDDSDIRYLKTLKGNDGKVLFEPKFLEYLKNMSFDCHVDAMPEGTVVFPHEPLVRVEGPIIQCQILESAILNIMNFQTLIATKAARVCMAARWEPVLEFGLRRAQGIDGALAASRAAYIGGCTTTSNTLAGKLFDIPVRGTQAHSWVMSFDNEMEAFQAYAKAMPNNCVFLVDTYDSLQGVHHAIGAAKWLRSQGKEIIGIRLDSGDLAYLSAEARKLLDKNGFQDAKIFASNELDEKVIASLKSQGAKIAVWGVGTKLATAYDEPALGGVYKLSTVREPGGDWIYKIKLSEQVLKVTNPGIQQIRRFYKNDENIADMIYDRDTQLKEQFRIIDPVSPTRERALPKGTAFKDLLVPIFKKGSLKYRSPSIHEIQKTTRKNLDAFHQGIKRLVNPHQYPVGLEASLYELKMKLVRQAKEKLSQEKKASS